MEYFSSSSSTSSFYHALTKPPICESAAAADSHMGSAGGPGPALERERMFEKVVTPSDVGKLNRLVIPKQHAEKYFPLDSAAGEKGLLLNFEECRSSGKSWRFRYSYWSSSQSYVITKGWSRFVKDKKLDAGDVVSFSRSFSADDSVNARLYIDWSRRRRPEQSHHGVVGRIPTIPWYYNYPQPFGVRPFPSFGVAPQPLHLRSDLGRYGSGLGGANYNYGVISQNSCLHHGSVLSFEASEARAGPTMVSEPVPVANEKAAPKRLRLFGVNMDCTQEEIDHQIPSPSLQLRLRGGDPSSGGAATSAVMMNHDQVAANFLGKGKSSMPLDFEV